MTDTKHCRACDEMKPLDQFRLLPPRKPGRAFTRHSLCFGCEREAARLRAAKRYNTDSEWREKQIANSAVQSRRQRARQREEATR